MTTLIDEAIAACGPAIGYGCYTIQDQAGLIPDQIAFNCLRKGGGWSATIAALPHKMPPGPWRNPCHAYGIPLRYRVYDPETGAVTYRTEYKPAGRYRVTWQRLDQTPRPRSLEEIRADLRASLGRSPNPRGTRDRAR